MCDETGSMGVELQSQLSRSETPISQSQTQTETLPKSGVEFDAKTEESQTETFRGITETDTVALLSSYICQLGDTGIDPSGILTRV